MMKSYLDLARVSSKKRRAETRLTRLCIAVAVFLIAAMFGTADMFLRGQYAQTVKSDGAWQIAFKGLNEAQERALRERPEVETCARYAIINYRLDLPYELSGVRAALLGFDEAFFALYPAVGVSEGHFPAEDDEALVSEAARERLSLSVGDEIALDAPGGEMRFTVSGFFEDTAGMLKEGSTALFLNADAYLARFSDQTLEDDFALLTRFRRGVNVQKAVRDIEAALSLPEDAAAENAKLLLLTLGSADGYAMKLYAVALALGLLVAVAGVLMISASLNAAVARRTEFFGLLRCLGATPRQVRALVRAEALGWCRAAIPAGLALGALITAILCGALRRLSPEYFGGMPRFGLSLPALLAGTLLGLFSVLAASLAPARRASRVPPLAAASGNAGDVRPVRRAAGAGILPVEAALGLHHAAGSRKNLLLVASSFAFSILLFLSFGVGVDFMRRAITPLRPSTPDVSAVSQTNACDLSASLLKKLKKLPVVSEAYARAFCYDLPLSLPGGETATAMLVSYDEAQFRWAEDDLLSGGVDAARWGEGVLLVQKGGISASPGENLRLTTPLGTRSLAVSGVLGWAPYDAGRGAATLICSEKLFRALTGETGYTIVDIRLADRSDAAARIVREAAGEGVSFQDRRASNAETRAVYWSFALCVYGFLALIALIAALNIVCAVSMSAAARMREYGAMRAVGASVRQLRLCVSVETLAYLVCALALGLALGLPLHRALFTRAVTERWGDMWAPPAREFAAIAAVMAASALAAVAGPSHRMAKLRPADTGDLH